MSMVFWTLIAWTSVASPMFSQTPPHAIDGPYTTLEQCRKDAKQYRPLIERHLQRFGKMESAEAIVVLLLLFITAKFAPDTVNQGSFYAAGIMGLITYIAVDGLGDLMGAPEETTAMVAKSGLSTFIYLEVMDASFSFDGVIGAFALSTNLFIIALGLGIGATCVRALTLELVKKKVLTQYRYRHDQSIWTRDSVSTQLEFSTLVQIFVWRC